MIDNTGMLDKYELSVAGSEEKRIIYINMYDYGDLYIPVGLSARKKI
jgi:uncharacterized protein YjfI (DUF2170 family)